MGSVYFEGKVKQIFWWTEYDKWYKEKAGMKPSLREGKNGTVSGEFSMKRALPFQTMPWAPLIVSKSSVTICTPQLCVSDTWRECRWNGHTCAWSKLQEARSWPSERRSRIWMEYVFRNKDAQESIRLPTSTTLINAVTNPGHPNASRWELEKLEKVYMGPIKIGAQES